MGWGCFVDVCAVGFRGERYKCVGVNRSLELKGMYVREKAEYLCSS